MSDAAEHVRRTHMKRTHIFVAVLTTALALLPAATWAFSKPIRVIAPSLNGTTCYGQVCVEDPETLRRAQELVDTAMANIAVKLKPLTPTPRAVFCSTRECYDAFGGKGRGVAVFNLGIVIPFDSWQVYIVEHELIHLLQAQELGLRGRESSPMWFKEGMAFYVSDPPDFDMPEYARSWVSEYKAWESKVGREKVWDEIQRR